VVDLDALEFIKELRARLDRSGGYTGPRESRARRAQIFISYERSDQTVAERLRAGLPSDQFEVWLDRAFLQGGDEWNAALEEKLQVSDYFVILNSANLASKIVGYVNKELTIALDRQKYMQPGLRFIIPLQIGGITAEAGRQDLARFQQVPLRQEFFEDDIGVLVRTISRDFKQRMR
jgi:hypothetical protein